MSRCCQGSSCDCFEEGYDKGLEDAEDDIDAFNVAIDKSIACLNEDAHIWPRNGEFVARINIDLPEGVGRTEKEAMGDLVLQLIERGLTLVAMRR